MRYRETRFICGECKKPLEECVCREVDEIEGLKANGYMLRGVERDEE